MFERANATWDNRRWSSESIPIRWIQKMRILAPNTRLRAIAHGIVRLQICRVNYAGLCDPSFEVGAAPKPLQIWVL